MSVSTNISRSGPYAGAGTVGPFTIGFRFLDSTHLLVTRDDSSGIETTLTLGTDYTVTGAGTDTGGTLVLTSALAVGTTLTIQRNVPITQLTDYTQSDSFPAEAHEDALDKLTMIDQQQQNEINGALRVPETAAVLPPFPALALRKNSISGFDGSGNPAVLYALPAASFTTGQAFVDVFAGTGAAAIFALSQNPGSQANLAVSVGGVDQTNGVDFTWSSGTTLTFTTAPPNGVTILVRYTNALPIATADASAVTFQQTGTGAVVRAAVSELQELGIKPEQFGAKRDDATDDIAAFNFATLVAISTGRPIVLTAGTYKISTGWVMTSVVRVIAQGAATIHCTGAGRVVSIDAGAVSGNIYGAVFGGVVPIKLKGNAATTDALFIRAVHHSFINIDAKDCVTAFRSNFAVCTDIRVECSVNTGAFALTPTNGMVLDARGAGEFTAACRIFPLIEGVTGTGIVGTSASFNTIHYGTAENNAVTNPGSKGITWSSACLLNNVFCTDFEGNGTSDIEDAGNNNAYFGVRAASPNGNVILQAGCAGANFHGGYLRQCSLDAASKWAAFDGVAFSDNGGLGIVGTVNATTLAKRSGCTRVNTSAVVTAKYSDLAGEWGQTYTPDFASAGGGTGGAITTQVGTYHQLSKLCHVTGNLSRAKGTLGAGAISVTGLPVQARNTTSDVQYIPVGSWDTIALGAGYTSLVLQIQPNTTTGVLIKCGVGVVPAVVNLADFPATMTLSFSGIYETV